MGVKEEWLEFLFLKKEISNEMWWNKTFTIKNTIIISSTDSCFHDRKTKWPVKKCYMRKKSPVNSTFINLLVEEKGN